MMLPAESLRWLLSPPTPQVDSTTWYPHDGCEIQQFQELGKVPVKFGGYFLQQWSLKLLWQPCPAPASEWRPGSFRCLQGSMGSAPSAFPASSLIDPHLALRVVVIWEEFMSAVSIVSLGSNPQVSHIFSFLGALGVKILVIFSPRP